MTAAQFIVVIALGLVGTICALLLLVMVGAWVIREHREEAAFRRELRLAHRREAQRQLDAFVEIASQLPAVNEDIEVYRQHVSEIAERN